MLVIAACLGFILRTWGSNRGRSLSGHGAQHRRSYLLFAAGLLLGGALFYTFAVRWLAPSLGLGTIFNTVIGFSIVCELVTALMPDNGGRNSFIHRTAAWTMAVCMFALVVILFCAPAVHGLAQVLLLVCTAYLMFDWVMFLFVKWSRPYFLIFQSSYIACFYAAILVATYVR